VKRLSLKQIRVLARIHAVEERQAWEDAKWERVAAFVFDVIGGSALGVALGLAAFIFGLSQVGV
jgi:hypothetical protein